jgi:hypothetical protein
MRDDWCFAAAQTSQNVLLYCQVYSRLVNHSFFSKDRTFISVQYDSVVNYRNIYQSDAHELSSPTEDRRREKGRGSTEVGIALLFLGSACQAQPRSGAALASFRAAGKPALNILVPTPSSVCSAGRRIAPPVRCCRGRSVWKVRRRRLVRGIALADLPVKA